MKEKTNDFNELDHDDFLKKDEEPLIKKEKEIFFDSEENENVEETEAADDDEIQALSDEDAEIELEITAEAETETDLDEEVDDELPLEIVKETKLAAVEEFDWDKLENENLKVYDEERKQLENLYTKTLSVITEMEVINAKVVNFTDKDVVLNIGFKSDGLVPLSEFKYNTDLKINDEVEVMVESIEGHGGQIILSHKKALAEKAWNNIVSAHDSGEIISGFVKDRTKGGMVVDVFGLDAFLPGSQLDVKPVTDYNAYVNTTMELKVVKLNPTFRNIVVSHKAIIEQDIKQQRAKILSKLEKGQVLEGVVKNLTSFGVFVDLGGVDGLIHITDVSWGRISHPNQLLEIGQKINVVVLDYDEEKSRISLGMKQLTPHPWETLPAEIIEGSILKGKVVNIEDYGAFVEIYPGVEGLVHVSEMTWSQHLKSPGDYVKLNDEVEVKVLSIIREERKLSLGMKQLTKDPWSLIFEKYPKDSKHSAIVKNITNFGLFVELEEGIDGLIHISDISWTKKFNHPAEFAKVGDSVDVVVLDVDSENRRLSIGHKQLEEDPWETFKEVFSIDSVHEGSIAKIDDKGATITLPYGIEGYCPNRHLETEDKRKPKVDDVYEFKVIEFDKSSRKIIVSLTQVWKDALESQKEEEKEGKKKEKAKTRKVITQVRAKVKKSTLASEIDVLQELKDKMIASEVKEAKEKKEVTKKAAAKKAAKKDTENAEPKAEE